MLEADAIWRQTAMVCVAVGVGISNAVPAFGQDSGLYPQPWQLEGTLAALSDRNEEVWILALNQLGQFELSYAQQQVMQADERYQDITNFLAADQSNELQASALRAISVVGIRAQPTALKVAPLLQDGDATVRQAAVNAIARMRASAHVEQVLPLLQDVDVQVRRAAVKAIGRLGRSDHASYLVHFLAPPRTENLDLRRTALAALVDLGARHYSHEILPLLQNSDAELRQDAIWALGQLGATDRIPELMQLLQDPRWQIREAASLALGELQATDATSQLVALLNHPSWPVQQVAVQTLALLGAEDTAPFIARKLNHPEVDVRAAAALALGQLEAVDFEPQLVDLLEDDRVAVRQAAVTAIGLLGLEENRYIALRQLDDRDAGVQAATLHTLVQLDAHDAVPYMLSLLSDRDPDVRQAAVLALGQLDVRQALPQLIPLLEDDSIAVHQATGQVLEPLFESISVDLAPVNGARDDVGAAHSGLTTTRSDNVGSANQGAEGSGPSDVAIDSHSLRMEPLTTFVLPLLEHRQWTVRQLGLELLGALNATDLLPEILALLYDRHPEVRQTALDTWEQLSPHTLQTLAPLLDTMYEAEPEDRPQLRFSAYYGSGGDSNAVNAIQWLGRPEERPTAFSDSRRMQTLEQLYQLWPYTAGSQNLRSDIALLMAQLVEDGDWDQGWLNGRQQRALFHKLDSLLRMDGYPLRANTIRDTHSGLMRGRQLVLLGRYAVGHAITWLMVWLLYPMSLPIQIVVWHPWLRRILGHGYIGWLLARVPLFRNRLFLPWLIPASRAQLTDGRIVHRDGPTDLIHAIAERDVHNYRLLTLSSPFLACDLPSTSSNGPVDSSPIDVLAFLPRHSGLIQLSAEDCTEGVEAAIRAQIGKTFSPIELDTAFFKTLIRNGALAIVLDNLSQASPDAWLAIQLFAKRYQQVRMLILIDANDSGMGKSTVEPTSSWVPFSLSQAAAKLNSQARNGNSGEVSNLSLPSNHSSEDESSMES